jgi:heparan-sulfate lyase
MKIKLFLLLVCVSLYFNNSKIYCQSSDIDVFSLLDLNYKGLENVKKLHLAGNDTEALKALLKYYRDRETVVNPAFKQDNASISPEEKKMAEDAMQHTFFSYNGFKPFNYGKDIDWTYWPVRDNELRWQLHRQKWFIPMGKMFYINGDEKYANEWTFQFLDWIKKNPLIAQPKKELSKEEQLIEDNKVDDNNMRYAWRPMEVSHRLSEQYTIFQLYRNSTSFTPEFLSVFLWNTHRHADFVLNHYSKEGNHLLFEAQRMLFAGVFFPEFKDAATWRKSGSEILVREMPKQIYPDGFQFELDPGYHSGCIGIFLSALRVAEVNGYADMFPSWYRQTISGMIQAYYNILLPDLSCPMFSDMTKKVKSDALKSFKDWKTSFPEDKALQYFISGGKSGEAPEYTSRAFKTSGFYIFRSDWNENATAMVLKAGPQAGWHAQPDNGTFNIMFNGRNFFPDAGSFSYGGDAEVTRMRESFKLTKVHNTLTLNNNNLEVTNSKCLLWKTGNDIEILVVENPSYKSLTHRRSVFFVDKKFFVVVDEAIGEATGLIGLHFNLCEGLVKMDTLLNQVETQFKDGNNMMLKTFCNQNQKMQEQEGWISYKAKEKFPREAFSFDTEKKDTNPVRYITVIMPYNTLNQLPKVDASFNSKEFNDSNLKLSVTINGKKTNLTYQLGK